MTEPAVYNAGVGYPVDTEIDGNLTVVDVGGTGKYGNLTAARIKAPNLGQGLQFLTGGGPITAATITAAKAAGYQGIFLDTQFVWDASGLVINGIKNFVIESRMAGSIGWTGIVSYNTTGYIKTDTGSPADGVRIFASSPGGAPTQGVIFTNCVLVGSHPGGAVVHLGGGQRRCGLVDSLAYNTSSAAGSYGVIVDTALSDNNSEDQIFSFTGGGGLAGAYAALGIGIGDQTQHPNDMAYWDLATAGGTYSIVKNSGGGHTFINYYDRSSPATATVWHHGGSRMTFIGGEDQNAAGLSHLIDNASAQTILINRTVTQAGAATTCQVSAGALVFRGSCGFNSAQTFALSGSGVIDLSDPAVSGSNATISGSAGTLMLAGNYAGPGSPPVLTSWTGTTAYQAPLIVAAARVNGATTTQTLTWTPPPDGKNHRFRISLMIHPTIAGTSTVPNMAFTEFGGSARNQTIPMWQMNSAAAAPSYTCAAADSFNAIFESETDTTGAAVTLTITPTGSTFRYSAVIEQLT